VRRELQVLWEKAGLSCAIPYLILLVAERTSLPNMAYTRRFKVPELRPSAHPRAAGAPPAREMRGTANAEANLCSCMGF